MSSCASDRLRAGLVLLALSAFTAGCARPPPNALHPVQFAPSCRFAMTDDLVLESVQVEVWAAAEGTHCGACRGPDASCALLSSRCIALPPSTPVGSLDVALADMTFPAAEGAVCVLLIGLEEPSCAGLPCTSGACDRVAYCATSRASTAGIALGFGGEAPQVCRSESSMAQRTLEECLFGPIPDAGARLPDVGVMDAGPSWSDVGRLPDARVPREGGLLEGGPPSRP